jgi:hypothetical protein
MATFAKSGGGSRGAPNRLGHGLGPVKELNPPVCVGLTIVEPGEPVTGRKNEEAKNKLLASAPRRLLLRCRVDRIHGFPRGGGLRRLDVGQLPCCRRLTRPTLDRDGRCCTSRQITKIVTGGIVSKRLGSPYVPGRSRHWVKSKNPQPPAVKREEEEDWGR